MLRLQLLGGFRAFIETGEATALSRQPRRAGLLAYLALERNASRAKVITMHWPDASPERGRHSLNQGIYYLRRIIGADWIELQGDRCVVASWVDTDVQDLERAAAAGEHETVLRLYEGPLLAGMTAGTGVEFEIWVDQRRAAIDRLHRRARRHHIAALLADGLTRDALRCAEEWSRITPLEDEAQHRHIELLAAAGQRAAALRQFASYRRLLDEHDLKPLDETLSLVEQLQQGDVGAMPVPETAPVRAEPAQPAPAAPAGAAARAGTAVRSGRVARLLGSRRGLSTLLAVVFLINFIETTAETLLARRLPFITSLRMQFARAAHWFEGFYSFEYHELTSRLAVIGYSTSYFFIFPLLLIGVGVALARRPGIRPYRVFSLAIVLNYIICLPFFLFVPVPERWAYPDSGAIVLSDLWSVYLIEVFRPISGLDNSFPSFHVSLTTVGVLTSFMWRLRFRWPILFLGATVVIATFILGIHWLPDLLAGAAAGVLGVALARRLDDRLAARDSADDGLLASRTLTETRDTRESMLQLEPQ